MNLEQYKAKGQAAMKEAARLAAAANEAREDPEGFYVPYRFVVKGIKNVCGMDPKTVKLWRERLVNMEFTQGLGGYQMVYTEWME